MPLNHWLTSLLLLWGATFTAAASAAQDRVLSALPVLHAITSALIEGTGIKAVRVIHGEAVSMEEQANALSGLPAEVFSNAHAVITLRGLWRADPLYPTARRQNLRIVEIDASRSWDASKPGLSVLQTPKNDVPWAEPTVSDAGLSPYAWLGPDNGIRMATLIAADLKRLSPPDANRVALNLVALEQRLRLLSAQYSARMAPLRDPRVLSLASEFAYLLNDFGVFVEGWYVQQDLGWRDEDLSALSQFLHERSIRVVVHKWRPDERLVKAIAAGGARLLVLDTGNPGLLADEAQSYEALLEWNLDALSTALAGAADKAAGDTGQRR